MKIRLLLLFSVVFSFMGINHSKASLKTSMIHELKLIDSYSNLSDEEKEILRIREFNKFIGEWGSSKYNVGEYNNSSSAITDEWLGLKFALNCRTLNEEGESKTRLYPLIQKTKISSYEKKQESTEELRFDSLDQSTQVNTKTIYSMDYYTSSGRVAVTSVGYIQNFKLENGFLTSTSPYEIKTTSVSKDSATVKLLKYDQNHLIGIIQGEARAFSRDLDRVIFCEVHR